MDWDEYCWALSDADYEELCLPTEMDYVEAIMPDELPTDDDSCMTPEAFNWSDDYCGNLWREFDDFCWEVALSHDVVYAEVCDPVNAAYYDMWDNGYALMKSAKMASMKKVSAKSLHLAQAR